LKRQQTDLSYPYDLEHMFLAQILFVQGDMPRLHDLLSRLLPAIEASGRQRLLLAGLVLQVQVLQAQGKQEQAITLLERVLTLAEPERYIRTFLDWGATLLPLLRHLLNRGTTAPLRAYIHTLLDAAGETGTILAPENILSEREMAVLQCIAAGKSNQEIAQEFVVALSTVKTHLNNLYSKLGVHSRTQAIARAKELQLL
jgi:LuxR family maltose regulon positive regulatory protein